MANLNTRIILKHGELSAAESSATKLHEGELVLAKTTDGYVAKVGLENQTYAGSADLYAHAKAEDVKYGESSNVDTELDRINTTLNTLTGSGAGTSIQGMIDAALGSLDLNDTADGSKVVTAVSQTDGKISVTRRKLGVSDIDELPATVTQVNTNATNITNIQGDVNDIKSRLGTLEGYTYIAGVGTQDDFKAFVKEPTTELIAGAIYVVTNHVDQIWDGTAWQELNNEYAWNELTTKINSNTAAIGVLNETAVRVKGNKLVYDTDDIEIIFDCGSV